MSNESNKIDLQKIKERIKSFDWKLKDHYVSLMISCKQIDQILLPREEIYNLILNTVKTIDEIAKEYGVVRELCENLIYLYCSELYLNHDH